MNNQYTKYQGQTFHRREAIYRQEKSETDKKTARQTYKNNQEDKQAGKRKKTYSNNALIICKI